MYRGKICTGGTICEKTHNMGSKDAQAGRFMDQTMQMPWVKEYIEDYDAKRYKDDRMYLKSMYPPMSQEILGYVTEECDKLEYEGSFMFDEYPDRRALLDLADRIKSRAGYMEKMFRPVLEEDENMEYDGSCVSCRGTQSWLDNLIWVILSGEIHYRRRRYFHIRRR